MISAVREAERLDQFESRLLRAFTGRAAPLIREAMKDVRPGQNFSVQVPNGFKIDRIDVALTRGVALEAESLLERDEWCKQEGRKSIIEVTAGKDKSIVIHLVRPARTMQIADADIDDLDFPPGRKDPSEY